MLFHSLRDKIMPLADEVIVYPGHGAGSACGKKMSDETVATLGNQKQFNYALRADMTEAEFVKEVTDGLMPPPQYFPKNAVLNKTGYAPIDDVMKQGLHPLSPDQFETAAEVTEALILDVRDQADFPKGFIPNAIFVGLDGNFATWVGTLIPDLQQPILLVVEPGKEEEAVLRLARVGYDNTIGYLDGGMAAWQKAGKDQERLEEVSPEAFAKTFDQHPGIYLDVRRQSEYASEHVVGIENFPLDTINSQMAELKPENTYYLHCQEGYRSLVASSILHARGYQNLVNIQGGFKALKETKLPLTEYVCSSTLL